MWMNIKFEKYFITENFEQYMNILNIYIFWSFIESHIQLSLLNGALSAVLGRSTPVYPSAKFIPWVVRDIGVTGGA